MASARDAVAQLVVVCQAIHQRGEAADFLEVLAAGGHDGAQGEVDAA